MAHMILVVKETPEVPVIFEVPGYEPDCRFTVFGQEFHAHSIVLKLKSAFFRKFFDSRDKEEKPTGMATSVLLLRMIS